MFYLFIDKVSSTILSATAFATSDPIMPDDDEIVF